MASHWPTSHKTSRTKIQSSLIAHKIFVLAGARLIETDTIRTRWWSILSVDVHAVSHFAISFTSLYSVYIKFAVFHFFRPAFAFYSTVGSFLLFFVYVCLVYWLYFGVFNIQTRHENECVKNGDFSTVLSTRVATTPKKKCMSNFFSRSCCVRVCVCR